MFELLLSSRYAQVAASLQCDISKSIHCKSLKLSHSSQLIAHILRVHKHIHLSAHSMFVAQFTVTQTAHWHSLSSKLKVWSWQLAAQWFSGSAVRVRYDWPSFQLFTGNLVQRYHAIGHHGAPHHGESRLTSHADYTQSASAGLWQLLLRGWESTWQVTQNFAAERKTECCRF